MAGKSSDGISILSGLVADTMSQVGESKPKRELTALAGETGAQDPLPFTPAPFPHDRPSEAVGVAIKSINEAIAELTKTRDALQLLATPESIHPVLDAQRKLIAEKEAEAAADKRASVKAALDDSQKGYSPERFSALQKQAQDATFTATEWTCPTHGEAKTVTSPKGRKFRICAQVGCKERE